VAWRLTVRAGSSVERSEFDALDRALDALEADGRQLARSAPDKVVDAKIKRFDPDQQVIGRLELSGPERLLASVHAGVDVHGDGSTEAFRGRLRRVMLEQRDGEDAFQALRRSLADVLAAAGRADA
jgi:hypothetical protein